VDRYSDDWQELCWVQALGRIDILPADAVPEALEALAAKYEPYRMERPPGPLLRLTPERILWWQAAQ
jgi:hypothetical protein